MPPMICDSAGSQDQSVSGRSHYMLTTSRQNKYHLDINSKLLDILQNVSKLNSKLAGKYDLILCFRFVIIDFH